MTVQELQDDIRKLKKKNDATILAHYYQPIEIQEIKRVADNNMTMPPKSTWVEPKLRSGLTIYNINE